MGWWVFARVGGWLRASGYCPIGSLGGTCLLNQQSMLFLLEMLELADIGPTPTTIGQIWSNLRQFPPIFPDVGRITANFDQC